MSAPIGPGYDTQLDVAFELSESVTNIRLRELYEILVHRMRSEARSLPMNTVQQLLIERICSQYVMLRAKEDGELGGFATASQQRDYNTFWLSMTGEFNRMLGKVDKLSDADRRTFLREIQGIIVATVQTVGDPKLRTELLQKMASAFETAGI